MIYNPFLPLNVCIADEEPHVFGDRVYLFGSHDKAGGETFCELGYEVWSAPVNDLGNWTSHGIVYSATQDPGCSKRKPYLFAPDVTRGEDGKFYLYYSLGGWRGKHGYEGPISVAVSNEPAGKYQYLGFVRNPDGTPFLKKITFDPGVMNDDGVIRLYFGTSYFFNEYKFFPLKTIYQFIESRVFDRTFREMRQYRENPSGAYTVELARDMRTVVSEPKLVVPYKTRGTLFEGHAFFEAASIRKLKGKYYFIYSSRNNHELCYAVSDSPDKGFSYGGTLISNGDIGYQGRKAKDRVNLTGNNHGSIAEINGKFYIFYHRMTDKSTYSRQACAEEIQIGADGHIDQVEMSNSGLNGKVLPAAGEYPAAIACVLKRGHMPHVVNGKLKRKMPCISFPNGKAEISGIKDRTVIGYRSFHFSGGEKIQLEITGDFRGEVQLSLELYGKAVAKAAVGHKCEIQFPQSFAGDYAIYFTFCGTGTAQLHTICFL